MPVVSVEVCPQPGGEELLSFDPELTVADLLAELDDESPADEPAVLRATCALADATVLQAAGRIHRHAARVVLQVASAGVRDRVLRALPGSGGRQVIHMAGDRKVVLAEGDILSMPVDAVVNASNRMLRLGAGVSGAIGRAAKPSLQAELRRLAGAEGVAPGDGVCTGAHGIPGLQGIVHVNAVSGAPEVVRAAAARALALAEEAGFASLAIPLLGTGTGGLAVEEGLVELAAVCRGWGQGSAGSLREVGVVLWSDRVFEAALATFGAL